MIGVRRALRLVDFKRYSPRTRRLVTLVAFVLILVGGSLAWTRLGLSLSELRVVPAFVIILTAPLTFVLSASEYLLLASAIGSKRTWREAADISIIGYASNLLPLPGGAVVRISSLVGDSGQSPKQPTQMTLVLAVLWLAAALLIGGVGFLALDSRGLGLAFCGAGIFLTVVGLFSIRSLKPLPNPFGFALRAFALEFAFVILAVVRTYFAFRVVDVDAAVEASMVVAASNSLSSSIGIVPAGLGVREGLAAVLAGLTGTAPAAGLLASLVLRLTGMVAALVGSALMAMRKSNGPPADAQRANI